MVELHSADIQARLKDIGGYIREEHLMASGEGEGLAHVRRAVRQEDIDGHQVAGPAHP